MAWALFDARCLTGMQNLTPLRFSAGGMMATVGGSISMSVSPLCDGDMAIHAIGQESPRYLRKQSHLGTHGWSVPGRCDKTY